MRIPNQSTVNHQPENTMEVKDGVQPSLYDLYKIAPFLKIVDPPEFTTPNPALCEFKCGAAESNCRNEGHLRPYCRGIRDVCLLTC